MAIQTIISLGKWQRCHWANSGRARGHAEEHQAGRDGVAGHCPPRGEFSAPRTGNVQISAHCIFHAEFKQVSEFITATKSGLIGYY